ncbi:MAG: type III-A CRISPR-associated protein Csm2 [Thiolinea sp.]
MNQQRNHRGGHNRPRQELPELDTTAIRFDEVDADLFSEVAENTARVIAANRSSNKATQLRRFYDEIVMWDNKVMMYQSRFNEYLPFIRMLNAKVAYAKGRKLVDDNFTKLLSHCLGQVNTPEQMQTFKLFMEAFMGFYKVERPRD